MVKYNKALFFDRDGTIIRSKISLQNKPLAIKHVNDCRIFPSAKRILNKFKKEFLIFLITNQPDVGRKENSKKNILKINNYLKKKLPIKKIYTCYCGNNNCSFRKPNIGMLKEASTKYKIDLRKSYVIGDRWKDINAGKKAKCRTVFIDKGYSEKLRKKPDYIIKNLYELERVFKF